MGRFHNISPEITLFFQGGCPKGRWRDPRDSGWQCVGEASQGKRLSKTSNDGSCDQHEPKDLNKTRRFLRFHVISWISCDFIIVEPPFFFILVKVQFGGILDVFTQVETCFPHAAIFCGQNFCCCTREQGWFKMPEPFIFTFLRGNLYDSCDHFSRNIPF